MAKPSITVKFKMAGFIDKKMVTAEFDLEVPEGTSVKDLFKIVDKSKKAGRKPMKKVMAMPRPPTVLINGTNIDVPDDLGQTLNAGDEIAVMTPLGGG